MIDRCEYEKRRRANESEEFIYGKEKNVQMNLLNLEQRDWRPNLSTKDKQKAVANCVWMLVVKIEGIERIYCKIVFIRKSNYLFAFQYV